MNITIKKYYTKIKESFQTAIVAAFIVIMVVLILYIPFKIIPRLMTNGTSFVATSISSLFIPNEENQDEEETSKTVVKENTTKKTPAVNTNSTQIKTPASIYYGKADLVIGFIATGIINKNTGQFYQTEYASPDDIIGVKFVVKNIGTNISGVWRLRINMPSKTTPNYDSDYQISLKPGDRIEYVANFENPLKVGTNTGYIVADYFNGVNESNESNNHLTIPIKIESPDDYDYDYDYDEDYNYENIKITCDVSNDRPRVGSIVTWSATVSGRNREYLYSWKGSDGLSSVQSSNNGVNKIYYTSGTKTARVTININGQKISKDCGSISVRK